MSSTTRPAAPVRALITPPLPPFQRPSRPGLIAKVKLWPATPTSHRVFTNGYDLTHATLDKLHAAGRQRARCYSCPGPEVTRFAHPPDVPTY